MVRSLGIWTAVYLLKAALHSMFQRGYIDSRFLAFSQAKCNLLGTEVSCTGTGTLSKTNVRAAGMYTKYKSAIVNEGITVLGNQAFYGCSSLERISLPKGLLTIGNNTFSESGLKTCDIPSTVTVIWDQPWNSVQTLQSLNVAEDNKYYSSYDGAIYDVNQTRLIHCPAGKRTLSFPSTVYKIEGNAMRWSLVVNVVLPGTMTTVAANALYAAAVETLFVPKSITSFGTEALLMCSKLREITLEDGSEYLYHDGMSFGVGTAENPKALLWISPETVNITIKSSVTGICSSALQLASGLITITSKSTKYVIAKDGQQVITGENTLASCIGGAVKVVVPSYVTIIKSQALRGCKHLVNVTFHSKIKDVQAHALRDCPKLDYIDFGGMTVLPGYLLLARSGRMSTIIGWEKMETPNIGSQWFSSALIEYVNISHCTHVASEAFYNASLLTKVVAANLQTIGDSAFYNCTSLTSINLKDCKSLTSIGNSAFAYCESLVGLELPISVQSLSPASFGYNPLFTSITFDGKSTKYASDHGVVYNSARTEIVVCPSGLRSITLLDSTKTIGANAFYGCRFLVDVKMNDGVETITEGSFYDCESIEMIRLPKNIKTIGKSAFFSCTRLRFVLYCNKVRPTVDGDANAFPTIPVIHVSREYEGEDFGGHAVMKVLDDNCNIPTGHFSDYKRMSITGSGVLILRSGLGLFLTHQTE